MRLPLRSHDDVTFRGHPVLIANLVGGTAGLALFVAVLVSVLADQPHSSMGLLIILFLAIVFFSALLVRQAWAASLTIKQDELVYRSTFWTWRIPRSSIASMDVEKTRLPGQGVFRWWFPRLKLTDGSTFWLRELKGVVLGGIDEPDHYSENLKRMNVAVHAWLSDAHPPIASIT
jgi:hypothetical protein